jgi:hypothetical protein
MNIFKKLYDDILNENYKTFHIIDIDNMSEKSLEYLITWFNGHYITEKWKIENIEPIYKNIQHPQNGFFDKYEYSLKDVNDKNVKFVTYVLYQNVEFIVNSLKTDNKEFNKLPKNSMIATVKFVDNEGKLNLTGNFGFLTKYVLDFVLNSSMDSLKRNVDKISGFYYTIDKNEEKRVRLYNKIIENIGFLKDSKKFLYKVNNNIKVFYLFA